MRRGLPRRFADNQSLMIDMGRNAHEIETRLRTVGEPSAIAGDATIVPARSA